MHRGSLSYSSKPGNLTSYIEIKYLYTKQSLINEFPDFNNNISTKLVLSICNLCRVV